MNAAVLVVEDDGGLREALCDTLRLAGYPVAEAGDGQAALAAVSRGGIGMVVTDVQMRPMDGQTFLERVRALRPDLPVVMMTAYGTVDGAVRAMRAGAVDYLTKPFAGEALIDRVRRLLVQEADAGCIAADPRSRALLDLARRVAASDATVLISGESGTGKEVLARLIHRASPRAAGPLVAINCAAIPESLLEATLFGHEKGAFTGACRAQPGKFEQARSGTLLLDEISEMPLALQAKLLRVLQEREVERVGGHETIALDVRVVATCNRELRAEVATGRFREDLYYRLNVFPLPIAALRERPGDILPLARHLLAGHARTLGRAAPELSAAAARRLLDHHWPGNVRELDNLVQRALILQPGPLLDAADLPFEAGCPPCAERPPRDDLKSREQTLILDTLREVLGCRQAAARRLGISPRTLRYKLARMRAAGIAVPGQRQ
ncbi:MAG: sigma-54 dependent transcriptional regulator [Pseudomonadota bacterium]|nr:sigma-54 dependent transcriptional regulator [Pseudomonadota bacterium]